MPGPSWLSPPLPEAFLRRGAGERWLGVVIGEACGKNRIVTVREEVHQPGGEPSATVPRQAGSMGGPAEIVLAVCTKAASQPAASTATFMALILHLSKSR